MQTVGLTYQAIPFDSAHSLYPLAQQTITQDGVSYTTSYTYGSSNFGDYLQPTTITESASDHSTSRVITRTFDSGFTAYILPTVASTTVTIAGESVSASTQCDHGTGFVTAATSGGMTTHFTADNVGNVATVTSPHAHQTTMTYQWVAAKTVTTPQSRQPHDRFGRHGRRRDARRSHHELRLRHRGPPQDHDSARSFGADNRLRGRWLERDRRGMMTTLDGLDRPIATQDGVGVTTTATYDAEGRRTFQGAR